MPFDRAEPQVPTSIGNIVIQLSDHNETYTDDDGNTIPVPPVCTYVIEVLDQNGERMEPVRGPLFDKITEESKQWILASIVGLRAQAEAEILGVGG
jgi:hypothetical protein